MNFLRDGSVLILGLGDSGLAMARWCARQGAQVQVWDSREQPPQAATLRAEWPDVRLFSGELGSTLPAGVKLLLKSPGLMPHDARIAPLLAAARAAGVAVMAELDLFAQALADLKAATAAEAVQAAADAQAAAAAEAAPAADAPAEDEPAPVIAPPPPPEPGYAPKVIAITGTNGKTTTTAMTGLLVERAGLRVAVAGNIGPTLLDRLTAMLDGPRDAWAEAWVLELSSFQLADAGDGFEPTAATVLNLTQDHLDWHGDMAAYAAAKARIFGRGATMVINRDDAGVEALVPAPVAVKTGRGKPQISARKVLRFGLGAPDKPGDFGLVEENGMAWLVRALPADETVKKRKAEDEELHLQRLMPADALRLRGRHNAANALAALALATAIGCPLAPMLHGLREYAGEPHRVQFVGRVGGVDAFDDSKGTNVGATVAALLGLGADQAPARLVLILGGDGKGQDFGPLLAPLQRHARAVALIGRDAPAIETALAALAAGGVPLQRHDTLPDAVAWCFAQAKDGDAVLLSPACASLDMFKNYAHRAQVFVDAVRALAAERGEVL
ncbi:MAG: UDP-N-acetylmuramoyl-L-alanine--D-glutamate ligase [Proteobacteria bacterium]|nr:UDP-N-acetylmuramoyl-L-alanine--D-glutamate ligase [Pseudomonadota bacterium]